MEICGRNRAEEFVIIQPNTTKDSGLYVAERIRRERAMLTIRHEKPQPSGIVTMSFGLSTRGKTDVPIACEKLIQQADTALYQARINGRNRVNF